MIAGKSAREHGYLFAGNAKNKETPVVSGEGF
jgi:hypothetical protein